MRSKTYRLELPKELYRSRPFGQGPLKDDLAMGYRGDFAQVVKVLSLVVGVLCLAALFRVV